MNQEYKLNRRQRMQIRIRKALKSRPSLLLLILVMTDLFLAVMVFPFLSGNGLYTGYSTGGTVITYADSQTDYNAVLTMNFAGDVMLGRYIQEEGEYYGYSQFFDGVRPYFDQADLTFVNLESTVADDPSDYTKLSKNGKSIYLSATRSAVRSMLDAGVNMVACANNHSADYGRKAIAELCEFADENEGRAAFTGIGRNAAEAAACSITEVNGIRVGFLSVTDVFYQNSIAKENAAGVFTTGQSDFNEVVSKAAAQSDVLVVYIHFGDENSVKANDEQKNYAHWLVDAGADIVIGSHPHVLQETEVYKDKMIFYSLGNFIFDQGNTYQRDSVLVQFTLDKDGQGAFELIPVRIDGGIPEETGNLFFTARINRELTQALAEDQYTYNEDGHVVINALNIMQNDRQNDSDPAVGTAAEDDNED